MPEFGDGRLPSSFWRKVELNLNSGCWLWNAATNRHGYGVYWVPGKQRLMLAHRASFEALSGAIGGLNICHQCDTPACVNPAHLFAGDQAANVRDMIQKGRAVLHGPALSNARKTHCLNGHPLSGAHVRVWRGNRICNICHADRERARKASKEKA